MPVLAPPSPTSAAISGSADFVLIRKVPQIILPIVAEDAQVAQPLTRGKFDIKANLEEPITFCAGDTSIEWENKHCLPV